MVATGQRRAIVVVLVDVDVFNMVEARSSQNKHLFTCTFNHCRDRSLLWISEVVYAPRAKWSFNCPDCAHVRLPWNFYDGS
jgi:hypothetical protein